MPPDVRAGLTPLLQHVSLNLGEVLYESGAAQQYVYFPTDSIVSLLYVLERRAGLERHVCECYAVVKREADRLLPHEIAT